MEISVETLSETTSPSLLLLIRTRSSLFTGKGGHFGFLSQLQRPLGGFQLGFGAGVVVGLRIGLGLAPGASSAWR